MLVHVLIYFKLPFNNLFLKFVFQSVKRNNKIAIKSEFEASNSSIFANQSVSSTSSTNSKESIQNKKTGSNGDRKLAQSAQLFHYQLQKQQIIDLEK